MRIYYIILLALFGLQHIKAQVNPPILTCIEVTATEIDIYWSPPLAPCGPVVGYEVFYSDQENGPYQSFTINDPAILDTAFASAFTSAYCFMQSIMNCPGQSVVNSDTLFFALDPPTVATVSVNTSNQVEVSWEASQSADIAGYLVFDGQGNPLDTVFGLNNTTYIDLTADPTVAIEEYIIAWFRDCDPNNPNLRRGSLSRPYHSILLENLDQDKCDKSFTFGWNRYENYAPGVVGYSINVSIDGSAYAVVDTVPNDQLIYLYPDAINDSYYCFKVGAILPNGLVAFSNFGCDSAKVVDAPRGAHIRNATVIDETTVHVEYFPDSAGIIDDLNFQRAVIANNDYQTWPATVISTSTTNPAYDTYADVSTNTSSSDYFYRFRRLDECGNEYFVDSVKTIFLEASLDSFIKRPPGFDITAELNWTPYQITNGRVSEYHIIKYTNGDSMLLATVSGFANSVEDLSAINTGSFDTVCYQIIAEIDLDIPGFVNTSTVSQSNIVCLQPSPTVVAPSAFKPSGINNIFKPIISFGTEEAYIFRVYDRWNRLQFETTNPQMGWDGLFDGNEAPLDIYVYYVSFLGQDGNTYSRSGAVALIR